MTIFHLVRHGETVWHERNRYAGVSDIELTAAGHQQANALGRWTQHNPIDQLFASPLRRALETAKPASESSGLEIRVDSGLREVNFGAGEGLTRGEMAGQFPKALERFLAEPAENPLPDGERGVDAIARARSVITGIADAHPEDVVMIVAHSTLLRLTLCSLLGINPNEYRRIFPRLVNVALTTLEVTSENVSLLSFNVPIASGG